LSWGAHGVVDFPLQDTLAPFGWEAPFSNAFYSWDAAIPRDPDGVRTQLPARWAPTRRFGDAIARYGPLLAATHRVATIAIADEVSASDPATLSNGDVAQIAAQLKAALRTCNMRGLTCDVVDLRYSGSARLLRYRTLVLLPFVRPPTPSVADRLMRLTYSHLHIVSGVPNERGSGITVLASRNATFGIAVNWSDAQQRFGGATWTGTRTIAVKPFTVGARDARLIVLALHGKPAAAAPAVPWPLPAVPQAWVDLNARQAVHAALPPAVAGEARATVGAAFGSGEQTVTLSNDRAVAVFVPDGGARLVAFAARSDLPHNAVNATGALRDDVLLEPPPSATDRIAAYTHSYPAGTFNRPYRTDIVVASGPEAVVRFTYAAPDLGPGAIFEKTVRLAAGSTRLVVDERVSFDAAASGQHAVTLSALNVPPGAVTTTAPSFLAWFGGHAIAVTWLPDGVQRATWTRYGSNGTLTLVTAANTLRTTYAIGAAPNLRAAQAFAQDERDWLGANPNPP
ncbi:MAG TPA: hypothetical protein VGP41_05245, partial [Candidatus Lustribacter sp.]|nr:hypothetical protein [Candidatus Lustribacter sp.]